MAERHDIRVRVISQKGTCEYGHKVGEEWIIKEKTPPGICLFAFSSLSADVRVLMFGGSYPWESDPDACSVACPDGQNPVVFEVRRLPR